MIWAVLGIVVVMLLLVAMLVRGSNSSGARPVSRNTPSAARATAAVQSPWRAVSIRPKKNVCEAAQEVQGKRYLVREAPDVPLENCDAPRCECAYQQHADRRADDSDRRTHFGIKQEFYVYTGEEDRRARPRGRRHDD